MPKPPPKPYSEEAMRAILLDRLGKLFKSQAAAARAIGVSPQLLSDIIAAKRAIGPTVADWLGYYTQQTTVTVYFRRGKP